MFLGLGFIFLELRVATFGFGASGPRGNGTSGSGFLVTERVP